MKRREVIKLVSLATGAAISAPLLSSLLTGCKKTETIADVDYELQFFNENEFKHIRAFVDVILPKTDSPSATELGVHKTIDTIVGSVYRPDEKENYKKNFSSFMKHIDGFLDLNNEEQTKLLQHINTNNSNQETKSAYLELKQQTIAYYLSTEEISKNYLTYLPVPGKYEPCITLEEAGGKAWAI